MHLLKKSLECPSLSWGGTEAISNEFRLEGADGIRVGSLIFFIKLSYITKPGNSIVTGTHEEDLSAQHFSISIVLN